MQSLLLKIISIPLILLLCTFWFEGVSFNKPLPFLIITIILAPLAVLMEYIFLPRLSFWLTFIADFVLSYLLVYVISSFMAGAYVSLWGAFLIALAYSLVELLIHKQIVSDHMRHSYS
ncbi:DUF2512 family protein [Fictibacillus enclensis]|uniref:DUF2512 family protein n=1 Tax=Fictibacillus enclensis TaxID=1017270 RepID=UPI0025A13F9F|nr:DUF2512 family protein [Fictibacillus enclensis]MDM5198409.1 DUF2512 family protein [Fictibacillus enclensis]